jgi:hypothetical protein
MVKLVHICSADLLYSSIQTLNLIVLNVRGLNTLLLCKN